MPDFRTTLNDAAAALRALERSARTLERIAAVAGRHPPAAVATGVRAAVATAEHASNALAEKILPQLEAEEPALAAAARAEYVRHLRDVCAEVTKLRENRAQAPLN